MPEGAKCDFDPTQIHDGETCGWKIPQHHSNHMSENPQYISNVKDKKGNRFLHLKRCFRNVFT